MSAGEITLPKSVAHRFWGKVDKQGETWIWTASTQPKGYGAAWDGERVTNAHRLAWRLTFGEIPDGFDVHHTCKRTCGDRRCCNPAHLELVTHKLHQTVEHGLEQTCANGHPWTRASTYIGPSRKRRRECRICMHDRYLQNREQILAKQKKERQCRQHQKI